MEPADPRALVLSYLTGLPTTIRTEALLFVIIYAIGIALPENSGEFENVVRDYLMRPGLRGVGAVLCTAAAIDYSFEGLVSKLGRTDRVLKIMAHKHPNFPPESRLSLPLRGKHWEQAWASWKLLRKTQLTPQKLQDFEDSQIRPPHVR